MPTDRRKRKRQQAILDAAMRYTVEEGQDGRRWRRATDRAVSDMLGAAAYLKLRLGEERVRETVRRLHETL